MNEIKSVILTPTKALLDSKVLAQGGKAALLNLYHSFCEAYPKFFKMDGLSRLGFLASEILLKGVPEEDKDQMGVIMFTHAGCKEADVKYAQTIKEDNFFPSPADFVYTLSNIVTGEVAIRHRIHGITTVYVLPERDNEISRKIIESIFLTTDVKTMLMGWIDYETPENYIADLKIITNQ